MAKWSIRRLRPGGKSTKGETTTLNPEMRSILMSLDGAYDPRPPRGTPSERPRDRGEDSGTADER